MNDPSDRDRLFDPSAPADPNDALDVELSALEEKLGSLRLRRVAPLELDDEAGRGSSIPLLVRCAAALLLVATLSVAGWRLLRRSSTTTSDATSLGLCSLEDVEGQVHVGTRVMEPTGSAPLASGDEVVSEAGASARVRIGAIGWLSLEERTRLRVAAGHGDSKREGAFRIDLERGTVEASIFAAPRVFALGTPSAIAVDLGCRYRATVDDAGRTTLAVVSGRVSFESDGRRVHVPAGASCRAWPSFGPGTPAWDDASAALRESIDRHDGARASHDDTAARRALDAIVAATATTKSPRDSLTLWHLLDEPELDARAQVYDALAALGPPPSDVTREQCLARDAAARERWLDELRASW
jgi:hypothetical protein